jgi:hypothetical protein
MTAIARNVVAAIAVMVCVLAVPSLARGAQYAVHACGGEAGDQNHLLTPSASDPRMVAYMECPFDLNGHRVGIAAIAGVNKGTVPVFANAMQSFVAPDGTTIQHVHMKGEGRTWNGDWVSLLQASTDRFGSSLWNVAGCRTNPGSANGCVSALGNLDQDYDLPGATGIRAVVACGNYAGCTTFSTPSWPFSRAYYFIQDFDVTLNDASAPSVVLSGGGLTSGQWLHGSQTVTYRATDNSGISRSRLSVDDLGPVGSREQGCDYTYAVPCSSLDGDYTFDTARVSDGPHRISVDASDATNANWGSDARTIHVDNHAPNEPSRLSVVGGEGWHTTDAFTIRWSNPASAAPVNRAYYEICKSGGSGCSTASQTGDSIAQLTDVQVGQPGDYTVRVWLADAAGNVSDAKSGPMHLKFDNVPPGQAAPQHRNGWVNQSDAKHLDQQIDPNGNPPVSGIAGYAVTSDGSVPGSNINVPVTGATGYVGHKDLNGLPEGTTTVKARAISGAGIPSQQVGSTDVHVDLTAPTVTVENAPDAQAWTRTPVALRIVSADPGLLSGMASGPDDRDVESGGYIRFSRDGAVNERVRGPQRDLGPDGRLGHVSSATADVAVATDGSHTVSYRAADVAGNTSPEERITFRIDQAPPELAVFEPQQQSDPRLVTVAASDLTSGLADGGRIQLRRIAPTRGDWISLHTARHDNRYYAHVDNATLPDGDYEFRATIPDQAGNEAVATMDRAGDPEILHITPTQIGPYPTVLLTGGPPVSSGPDAQDADATVETTITAQAVKRTVTRRKCKRRRPSRAKKCPGGVRELLVHELRLPFGKRASIRGALTTAAGAAIPGTEVTVLARPARAGAAYAAEASIRTDSSGAFTYRAPAGAGRPLDLHYRGDEKYKHADDQVTLRVPAAVTITASRHSIRNGQHVRFAGKLLGRPYPARGKVLDLQAYYRRKWRTFATPRAALNGPWTQTYRFEATRGTVLYRFRVRVRATSDYPYELGYSRVTNVRVVGP